MGRKHHEFLVYRQEKLDFNPIMLITAETEEELGNDYKLLEEFRTAVMRWVEANKHDHQSPAVLVYIYAGDDMNILDVVEFIPEILRHTDLIHQMSVCSLSASDHWEIDTSVCDLLEDVNEEIEKGRS